jgi:predicted nucleic acid-binding protein
VPLVVDSSVAGCWALPDETSEIADRALARIAEEGMIVSGIFPYEIRNVLLVNERRGRLQRDQADQAIRLIMTLGYSTDLAFDENQLLRLARRYNLSVYDASYLELAQRTNSTLATLDRRLLEAAVEEMVEVMA